MISKLNDSDTTVIIAKCTLRMCARAVQDAASWFRWSFWIHFHLFKMINKIKQEIFGLDNEHNVWQRKEKRRTKRHCLIKSQRCVNSDSFEQKALYYDVIVPYRTHQCRRLQAALRLVMLLWYYFINDLATAFIVVIAVRTAVWWTWGQSGPQYRQDR